MAKTSNSDIAVSENEWRWRAEDDLRTYEQWMKIKKDKKRLANMRKIAKERLQQLQGVVNGKE